MRNRKWPYLLVLTLAASLLQLSAQTTGGGGKGSGGTTGTTTTTVTPPPRSTPTTIPNPDFNRPVFIGGRVLVDDGSPLPEPAAIQRVCGNSVRREGYTNSDGHFSFLLSNMTTSFQDASESSPFIGQNPNSMTVDVRKLWGCEIRAYLGGFTSSVVTLAGRNPDDMQNLGVITLHRNVGVDASSVSVTSLKAPSGAKKAFDKANDAFGKGKFEDADKFTKKATDEYPEYAIAWDLRGRTQEQMHKLDDAEQSYENAIRSDSKYVPSYIRLAVIQASKQKWPDVVRLTNSAIEADPTNYAMSYFLNAAGYFNTGDLDKAEHSAMRAIALDKQHQVPRAELLAATIYTRKGNTEAAIPHLQAFVKLQPNAAESAQIQKYLADRSAAQQSTNQPQKQ